jgi:general secretion pathway protein G
VSKGAYHFYFAIGFILMPLFLGLATVGFTAKPRDRSYTGKAQIAALRQALDSFRGDVGRFPTSTEGLQALQTNPGATGWAGPYLAHELRADPWGRAYIYQENGPKEPEIVSLGRDGKAGGRGPDQDLSSLHLDDPVLPSAEQEWGDFRAIAVCWIAALFVISYPFLPWMIRRHRRPRGMILP